MGRCVKATSKNRANTHCKRPISLEISYKLSSASSVKLTVRRQTSGRRVNGRCLKPTKKNAKQKSCKRLVALQGSVTITGTAGDNTFTWNGTIGGHKANAGTYELIATPTGGETRSVTFKIVR